MLVLALMKLQRDLAKQRMDNGALESMPSCVRDEKKKSFGINYCTTANQMCIFINWFEHPAHAADIHDTESNEGKRNLAEIER